MTIRRYPRTAREAFRDWPENCFGVERPIEVGRRSLWDRLLMWCARLWT